MVFVLIGQHLFAQNNQETIVDEQFAMKPFQFDVTEKNLVSKFKCLPKRKNEPIERGSDIPGDSIVTLSFGKDSFYFLKNKKSNKFYGAEIATSNTKLSQGLYVGMSKSNFLKTFHKAGSKSNIIMITDINEVCYHYFYFKNSKLVMIKIDSCLD